MKQCHRLLALILLASALALALPAAADPDNPEPLSAFPQSLLAIRTQSGSVLNFQVWTADNRAREEQGLMYVREMDDHAGMLFVFPSDQRLSMWMKNTFLPLDMLFLDAHGRIEAIVPNATPLSLEIISPKVVSRAVLELKGGMAALMHLNVGDLVLHQSLKDLK